MYIYDSPVARNNYFVGYEYKSASWKQQSKNVEVSESSLDFDRNIKMSVYVTAGILVYWIIDLKMNTIEVMEAPEKNQYTRQKTYFPGDTIAFHNSSFVVAAILLIEHL